MRDFFARQEAARRQSRWLLLAYAIALACVIGGIGAVAWWLASFMVVVEGDAATPPHVVAGTACVLVAAFIGGATLYKMVLLRGGGDVVARGLGGVRVDPGTADPMRRRLINVVEEMAIASGVPVPQVYVLERETAINALSAGHSPADAAIAVTAGMLRRLNREQLQAVVAHEFSHILNGDMRLSVRLMGLNFGLLALAMAGRFLLRVGGSSRKGKGGGLLPLALAAFALGYVGLAAGRVLQAMVSRRRERLADASAVQFTRNPEGLRGALVAAAAEKRSTWLQVAAAEEVAHMLFFAGGRRLLATHPPVLERLRALDPGYDEDRLRQEVIRLQLAWDQERSAPPPPAPRRTGPGAAGAPVLRGGVVRAVAAAVLDTIGDPTPRHVAAARELRRQLPRALERMCGVPDEARAFVIALLLSDEAEVRARQAAVLEAAERARLGLEAAAGKVRALAAALPAQQRLSAVLRLFPALRQLPAEEQDDLGRIIADLALADGRLDVFEFALGRLVACELHESRNPRPPHGRRRLDELLPQIALLVAVLGRHGADDGVQSRRAYSAGMARLSDRWPDFHAPSAWAAPLSAALEALRDLQPAAKELLMEALVTTVTHDGQVRVAEAELLRTVAVLLQCPLPPLLPDGDIP